MRNLNKGTKGRFWAASLVALAVVGAGIYAVFAHDMARARARLVGRSDLVDTSFGVLEYAALGEGKPILVVHGAGGGFDQAIDMTGVVTGSGYRVIAPSRFGYLRSEEPAHATTEMQADAYVQLLDHLGIDKVAVVGISAGAWSSLQFAIRHPERCLAVVLLVPADYLPEGTSIHGGLVVRAMFSSDFLTWAALELMPIIPGGLGQTMLGTDDAVLRDANPAEKARVRQVLEHLLPMSQRSLGMRFDVQTAATRESYPLERIACPVLAISAEDDRFGTAVRAKAIASRVRDGRAIVFLTGGHALVGHSADALRETISFLGSLEERGNAPRIFP
jgi:2-hydroxy-6-oxonona-2,4-dienedioate hydrolase